MDLVTGAILVLLGIAAVAVAGAGYLIDQQRQQIEREVRTRSYA
jgi:hypothetical protein